MAFLQRFMGAFAIAAFLFISVQTPAIVVTPEIFHPADRDRDFDGIDDDLEARIARALAAGKSREPMAIVVTLYHPPSRDDFVIFKQMEGIRGYCYQNATYGFSGIVPADRITDLARALGDRLCIIERDLPGGGTLDDSARQVRVRPLVWDTTSGYGLSGEPDIVIAVFNTGIDSTHTDLSGGKLVF